MSSHTRIMLCPHDAEDINITISISKSGNVIGIITDRDKLKEIESMIKSIQVFWKE